MSNDARKEELTQEFHALLREARDAATPPSADQLADQLADQVRDQLSELGKVGASMLGDVEGQLRGKAEELLQAMARSPYKSMGALFVGGLLLGRIGGVRREQLLSLAETVLRRGFLPKS